MSTYRYCDTHGVVPRQHQCGRWTGGSTRAWRKLRAAILTRDNHSCWCGAKATEVHHITDTELRSVCFNHNPRGNVA